MNHIIDEDLDVTFKMMKEGIEAGEEAAKRPAATKEEVVTAIYRAMVVAKLNPYVRSISR